MALALSPAAAGPALLFDAADGRVLYAEDADNQWHPASLTKIMTAYLTFEAIKEGKLTLETKIACSEIASQPGALPSSAWPPGNSHYGRDGAAGPHHQVGQRRGGDAGRGRGRLARGLRGADERHRRPPRHDAHPVRQRQRPAGARADHHRARSRPGSQPPWCATIPSMRTCGRCSTCKVGKRHLRSHNGLLTNYAGADGLKTGFICDSGFNVVASATRDGRKMIAVVLGEATGGERSVRAANLLEHGFQTLRVEGAVRPADARDHAGARRTPGAHDHPPARQVVRVRHGRPAPRRGQDRRRRGRSCRSSKEGPGQEGGRAKRPLPPRRQQ